MFLNGQQKITFLLKTTEKIQHKILRFVAYKFGIFTVELEKK